MGLHTHEIPVDAQIVHAAVAGARPEWGELPLRFAGGGTDNVMYRLGSDLVVRIPRTLDHAEGIQKEADWIPRFSGRLPVAVPSVRHVGAPGPHLPLPWLVLSWLPGQPLHRRAMDGWSAAEQSRLGRDLAKVVQAIRLVEAPSGHPVDPRLQGYRGGDLAALSDDVDDLVTRCGQLLPSLDEARVRDLWRLGVAAADDRDHGWLHADLRPANLLVRDRTLSGVIDFGMLTYGRRAAEHAPVWDLPLPARQQYRARLDLDDAAWLTARAWALFVALSGIPYYWDSDPDFAGECRDRLHAVLTDTTGAEPPRREH